VRTIAAVMLAGLWMNLPKRRNAMYHFTIIDEASKENERLSVQSQELTSQAEKEPVKGSTNIIRRSAHFLHRYLEQPNCVRIYISKN
jgi:hypothetical protein